MRKRIRFGRKILWPAIMLSLVLILVVLLITFFPHILNPSILNNISLAFIDNLPELFLVLVLFFIFKLISALGELIIVGFSKSLSDYPRSTGIIKLVRFGWWILFLIIIASLVFGNLSAFIMSLGLIGLGLTFALQKPILNFVGWFTIVLKNIYQEGDRVKIGIVRGDVKEIQLMNTVLYGLLENSNVRSHKIVTVPNELVLTTDIENFTKESNYILEELTISITYESNYTKAMLLLRQIVTDHIKKNHQKYIQIKKEKKNKIDSFISAMNRKSKTYDKQKLIKQSSDIQEEIKTLQELEGDFKPKIRLEMADSSLLLIAQFITPYDEVKKHRTGINVAFLDAIAKEKDIEVAYPHMELVYHGKKAL